jgi:hypothetical protein
MILYYAKDLLRIRLGSFSHGFDSADMIRPVAFSFFLLIPFSAHGDGTNMVFGVCEAWRLI